MSNAFLNTANYPAAGKAGIASLFAFEHHCPGLPEPGRYCPWHRLMERQNHFSRKRVLVAGTAMVIYAVLWLLTQRFGVPQVRSVLVNRLGPGTEWTDMPQLPEGFDRRPVVLVEPVLQPRGPVLQPGRRLYYCNARAYGPFVVRAEHGFHHQQRMLEYRDYDDDLYCWVFGRTFRIRLYNYDSKLTGMFKQVSVLTFDTCLCRPGPSRPRWPEPTRSSPPPASGGKTPASTTRPAHSEPTPSPLP